MKFSSFFCVLLIIVFSIVVYNDSSFAQTMNDVKEAIKDKEYDKAESMLQEFVQNPKTFGLTKGHLPRYYFELGKVQFLNAKYKDADKTFKRISELDTKFVANNPEVKTWIKKVKKNLQVLYPSETDLNKKHKMDEVQSLLAEGEFKSAKNILLKLLKDYNESLIWFKLGEVQYHLKNYEAAQEAFQQADELDPQLLSNYRYMSIVYSNSYHLTYMDNNLPIDDQPSGSNWGINILIFASILLAFLAIGFLVTKLKEGSLTKKPRNVLSDIEISLNELRERIDFVGATLSKRKMDDVLESFTSVSDQFTKLKDGNKSVNPDKLREEISKLVKKLTV